MKQIMMCAVAVLAMTAMAEITNTVKVTKFHQSYPYTGKATVECTVGTTIPTNVLAEITISTDDKSATFTQKGVVTGSNTFTIDFASSFDGAMLLTNASFVVTIAEDLGGVQLWENGPYWAECNVGASKPEEDGYYFWWGDTVGYTRSGGTWEDYGYADGSGCYSGVTWVSSTGEQMNSSPFSSSSCPTYGKDNSVLLSAGYIDSTDNLVAAYDAATAHLGAPWRMPTSDEIAAIVSNCTTMWITTNGVSGRLVTGKGAYANRSIFLPAVGYGHDSCLSDSGPNGYYWSSSPCSDNSSRAWSLYLYLGYFRRSNSGRFCGQSVRPVRGFAEVISAVGIVTYDPAPPVVPVISPASGTTFESSLTVSISCETEGAAIYYTTDGSEPTKDSTAYRRFKIYGKTTVKAVAYDAESGMYSEVTTAEYAFGTCSNPVIVVEETFFGSRAKCEISCATEGANIFYTLDGSTPTSHSTRNSGAFYITDSCTIKAIALLDDYIDSEVAVKSVTKEWTIGDTMGAPDHAFATSGDDAKAFYRVEDASAPNGEAMHSGAIDNSGAYGSFARTVLSTTVIGPGTVSFSWKASCEDDAPDYEWDHGEFAVDGVIKAYVSGETGWTNVSVMVTGAGEHTLTWTYLKDDAAFEGEDCIWVAGYGWASAEAYTHTTDVPVPYAWLTANWPDVVDEYEAYEAAANATAANGRMSVAGCYVLGLDPQDATSDFRIASFPMKADGTPDLANITYDPPREQWNVPDAPVVLKGAATLEGPWRTVTAEGGSPGTARPTMRFFKAVVFGDTDDDLGGVQLWENGPYWAECNVGASKPEEYGYYFWWGDTVGYTPSGGTLTNNFIHPCYYSGVTWVSSTGTQMGSSPFAISCPTYEKENAELLSAGYIDSTGNLVAAHDAATAHLGAPWRMPTSAEIEALTNNCTTMWITTNGVNGRLVTGTGAYANRSIFLPAAGYGSGSNFYDPGSQGDFWASTPIPDFSYNAWRLYLNSSNFRQSDYSRYLGQSVRPVRGSAE